MTDFLLIIALLLFGVFGYFVMWRLDKLLDEIRKERYSNRDYEDEEDD